MLKSCRNGKKKTVRHIEKEDKTNLSLSIIKLNVNELNFYQRQIVRIGKTWTYDQITSGDKTLCILIL